LSAAAQHSPVTKSSAINQVPLRLDILIPAILRKQARALAELSDMRHRAHLSGWVPDLRVGLSRNQRDSIQDYTVPDARFYTAQSTAISGSLIFRFPKLLYFPNEGAIAREARRIREVSDRQIREVIRLFHERQRLIIASSANDESALDHWTKVCEIDSYLRWITGLKIQSPPKPQRAFTGQKSLE